MNKYKLHTLINSAKSILEDDKAKKEDFVKIFQIMANELQDPFASSIDEFLAEKESKQEKEASEDEPNEPQNEGADMDHPQEDAVDTLKEEAVDYQAPLEQDHPQEDAVDTLKEEATDYQEAVEQDHPQEDAVDTLKEEAVDYDSPVEQDQPQEDNLDKVGEEVSDEEATAEEDNDENSGNSENEDEENTEDNVEDEKEKIIESKLKRIGSEIANRGYAHIANKFIKASSIGILETLNNLIMQEFLIRDILENYAYLFEASVAADVTKYKPRDSLLFLQKQIIFLGSKPTTQRLAIPAINPCGYDSVIELIKESTRKLIESYLLAIASVENEQKYLTLKVMLQKIVQTKTCLCEVQVG